MSYSLYRIQTVDPWIQPMKTILLCFLQNWRTSSLSNVMVFTVISPKVWCSLINLTKQVLLVCLCKPCYTTFLSWESRNAMKIHLVASRLYISTQQKFIPYHSWNVNGEGISIRTHSFHKRVRY